MPDRLTYYFDEHMPRAVAQQLRLRSIDVLTAREAGRALQGIPDEAQLAFAANAGRVFVTEDRDFIPLAYAQTPHAGVIVFVHKLSYGEMVEYLEVMSLTSSPASFQDRLEFCKWP